MANYSNNRGSQYNKNRGNSSGHGGYNGGKGNLGQKGFSGGKNGNAGGYIGAPYNFVPFTENTVVYKQEQPGHDEVSKKLLSGEIAYHIKAQSPVIVDDGQGHFWRNAYGDEAIAGSTVRGLIRNNVQILSLSGVSDDVDDYALMYRNVASGLPKQKKLYGEILGADTATVQAGKKSQTISILRRVRVGYLVNENGDYNIYDTDIDRIDMKYANTGGRGSGSKDDVMNYYVLSERKLAEEYMQFQDRRISKFAYPFFVKKGKDGSTEFLTEHRLDRPFRKEVKNGRTQYIGTENKKGKNDCYKPYSLPCSYNVSGRNITGVDKPGILTHEGYAVSTGRMKNKKAIYIIPKMDMDKKRTVLGKHVFQYPITISDADLKAFDVDINKRENTLKQFGERACFDLPKPGIENRKPVFYIYEGGRLYFGFTPRLRLFFEHTIREGLPKDHTKSDLDFAKALFGYSNDEGSFKSRVSFSDAVVTENQGTAGVQSAILAEPKPTSYLDYVMPLNGEGQSYNDRNFHLRGIKQYWLRDNTYTNVTKEKEKEAYVSHFTPLAKGTVFAGKVRFHNLKKEELGLLLWSMHLDGKSWMNVGKAKSFGYGNIQLIVDGVQVLDPDKAYDLTSFCLEPYKKADMEELIQTYKDFMNDLLKNTDKKQLKGKKLEDLESIRTFFAMKNPEIKPAHGTVRFMEIEHMGPDGRKVNEYQNRRTPLKTVKEILGNKM